jgi:hypothetical protein
MTGQCRADHCVDVRWRSIGNRCRRPSFEAKIVGSQLDAGRQIARSDNHLAVLAPWVGSSCRDGGEKDKRAGRKGGQKAGQQRRIE